MMKMAKTDVRGSLKMAFCKDRRIAVYQWLDSKVVNCVSSYLHFGVSTIKRQVGSNRKNFTCPAAIVHYQQHMGAIDRADQMRAHFGGFAAQSHFKKWYKKVIMAVMDCMLLNGLVMWNLSAEKVTGRRKMHRFKFFQAIAHELLYYKTEEVTSPIGSPGGRRQRRDVPSDEADNSGPHVTVDCYGRNP